MKVGGWGQDNPNTIEKLIWYAVYLMSKYDGKVIKVILQISSLKGVIQWLHCRFEYCKLCWRACHQKKNYWLKSSLMASNSFSINGI